MSSASHHSVCLAEYSMKPGSNNGIENLFKQKVNYTNTTTKLKNSCMHICFCVSSMIVAII
jgi:hypothetical protein